MRYNEITRRYFESTAHAGILTGADVYHGMSGDRQQGTWIRFDMKVAKGEMTALPTIGEARFLCFGCPHTIAICAWLAESAAGRPLARALPEDVRTLSERFDLPADKLGRVLLIEDAWLSTVAGAIGLAPS